MFQFNPQQLKALGAQHASRFATRAVVHLRSVETSRFAHLTPAQQQAEVAQGIDAARRAGLTGEADVIVFLEARCLVLCLQEQHRQDVGWVANLFVSASADLPRTFTYVRDVAREKLARLAAEPLEAAHA